MTPIELFAKVRMDAKIQDNTAIKYSSYNMLDALNNVLNIVFNGLSSQSDTIISNETDIMLTNGVGDLPDDFLSITEVFAPNGMQLRPARRIIKITEYTYRIVKNKIYSANESLHIIYKIYFKEFTYDTMEEQLPLPDYFSELLKKYCVVLLTGGATATDTAIIQQITQEVSLLTAGREYSQIDIEPPWRV